MKLTVHIHLLNILVLLIFTKFLASSSFNSTGLLVNNISKIISLSNNLCTFNPFTVRLVNFNEETEISTEIWALLQNYPKILGDNESFLKILEPDQRRIKSLPEGVLQLYSFFTIVYYSRINYNYLNSLMEKTVNPKLDFVLLLWNNFNTTLSSELISETFQCLSRFLNKIVLNIHSATQTIWIDPLVYSKGLLIPVVNVPTGPIANLRMGYNLRGRHLFTSITGSPPYCYVEKGTENDFKGVYINIMKEASSTFNFTYTMTNDGTGYGKQLENGTWIGKYARVYYSDSGYDVALLIPNDYAMRRGDRSASITAISSGFSLSVPRKENTPWYAFFKPFRMSLWILTIATFVVLGIMNAILVYQLEEDCSFNISKLWHAGIFLPLSIALDQCGSRIPKSLQNLTLIWVLGCLILGTGYKSKLRAHLMFPHADRTPSTFEELAEMPEFKITLVLYGNIEEEFYLHSNLALMRRLRPRFQINRKDIMKCLRIAFFEEKHVCIMWGIAMQAFVANEYTLNTTVPSFLFSQPGELRLYYGFAFQEHSIFVTAFHLIISMVFEMGLTIKWENEILVELKTAGRQHLLRDVKVNGIVVKRLKELGTGWDDKSPLRISNLIAVFGILCVGLVMGIVSALVEKYRYFKKYNQKLMHVEVDYMTNYDYVFCK